MSTSIVSKRTVLITGCSPGGIGHAMALEYHSRGFQVFATSRKVHVLDDLKQSGINTLQLDVTDASSVRKARDDVAAITGGTLDVLVNNAGQANSSPATDLDLGYVRTMFDTNVFGVMSTVQEFVPLLIPVKGKIVNIGSVAAILPMPFMSSYSASKAALHVYLDTLRLELKPFGVQVVTVAAGGVATNIARDDPKLVQGSIYEPMSEDYTRHILNGRKIASARISAGEFAKRVVSRTNGRHPPHIILAGKSATTAWFLTAILPRTLVGWILTRISNLKVLPARLKAKAKSV